ncbi:Enhancer of polycomb-like protein 1 [Coemansia sp. RSA 552]|nr:Enhancer of polycomb-like protein 1 [Coemansia sp. RSA 552]
MVNAQRFRARKVDLKRALPVFRAADLDDLDDDDNRQVDAIETGVEKDEEAEHHLQAAISATNAAANGQAPSKQVYIPTPDASRVAKDGYDKLYPRKFMCPTSLIRSSETVEECCAPMYCLDDEDELWLNAQSEPMDMDAFEQAMDQLEHLTRDMVFQRPEDIPSVDYLAAHAADREQPFQRETVERVYEHWRQRREERGFNTVQPHLQIEDPPKAVEIDPYVCFRRREVRQGRKTRRADQRSLEQLRRLRVNLAMAAQVLEMCLDRETVKTELVEREQEVARQRANVIRMRRRLSATAGSWDDLFVLPVQHRDPQPQRKRLGAAQRPRVAGRKARVATGLASAAAAAAAANGLGPYGEPALPLPYVLPRTVSVHPYTAPKRLQSMASRIDTRMRVRESQLENRDFVDATFPNGMPLHTNRTVLPQMCGFWSPASLGGSRPLEPPAPGVGFRLRRGRLGRLFVDRRVVRPEDTVSQARVENYRLGLLTPEDHRALYQCRTPKSPAGLPEELLRPFSFSADLFAPQAETTSAQMPAVSVPASVGPLSVASLDTAAALPMLSNLKSQLASIDHSPLSRDTIVDVSSGLGTPNGIERSNMSAMTLDTSEPSTPSAISSKRSISMQLPKDSPETNRTGSLSSTSSSTSLSLNVPVLSAAISPQIPNR